MTTPVIEQMFRHTSVRNFNPTPVPREMVETIVAAGQRAPTSSNLQSYSVVAVTEDEMRKKLGELCGKQHFIFEAPVFLVWCADLSRMERICRRLGYKQVSEYVENFLVSALDAGLAMQNASLAAESLGLGMCYVGAIRNRPEEVIELLGLPKLVFPVAGMSIGWPVAEQGVKQRLPLKVVLHWERYDYRNEAPLLETYDQEMIASGLYEGRQLPVAGAPPEIADYGWTEHSARRVSRTRRTHLRRVLEDQGFNLE